MPERKPRSSHSEIMAAVPRIVELYHSGKPIREIAREVGVSRETVRRRLISYGVEVQPRGVGRPKKTQPPKANQMTQEEIDRLRRLVGFDPKMSEKGIRVL